MKNGKKPTVSEQKHIESFRLNSKISKTTLHNFVKAHKDVLGA